MGLIKRMCEEECSAQRELLELKQVSLVIKEIKMVWIVGFKDDGVHMAIQKTTILKDCRQCRHQVARPTGDVAPMVSE